MSRAKGARATLRDTLVCFAPPTLALAWGGWCVWGVLNAYPKPERGGRGWQRNFKKPPYKKAVGGGPGCVVAGFWEPNPIPPPSLSRPLLAPSPRTFGRSTAMGNRSYRSKKDWAGQAELVLYRDQKKIYNACHQEIAVHECHPLRRSVSTGVGGLSLPPFFFPTNAENAINCLCKLRCQIDTQSECHIWSRRLLRGPKKISRAPEDRSLRGESHSRFSTSQSVPLPPPPCLCSHAPPIPTPSALKIRSNRPNRSTPFLRGVSPPSQTFLPPFLPLHPAPVSPFDNQGINIFRSVCGSGDGIKRTMPRCVLTRLQNHSRVCVCGVGKNIGGVSGSR